ncbi:MAG: hypothetical protein ACHQ0Y_02425 [Thermodesulfovibrionales bacterium]
MKHGMTVKLFAMCFCVTAFSLLTQHAAAGDGAKGKLVVDGKKVEITQAYAYAEKGFFDNEKQDVVVLLCDAPVLPAAVRDFFARKELIDSGKLHCVEQIINSEKQVVNFKVHDKSFGSRPPSGGSTEHVFDAKTFDGITVAGRSYTKSQQSSFDDIPYSYDITFSAPIGPMK